MDQQNQKVPGVARLLSKAADYLFNLSKSPWWGGLYKKLIKDVKKMFYKTRGRTSFQYEQLETVVMDIERHLNNCLLMCTYVENKLGEEQVLMLWDNMYANSGRENTLMVSWRAITSEQGHELLTRQGGRTDCQRRKKQGRMEKGSFSKGSFSSTQGSHHRETTEPCMLTGDQGTCGGWYCTCGSGTGVKTQYLKHCTGCPSEVAAVITRRRLRTDADYWPFPWCCCLNC